MSLIITNQTTLKNKAIVTIRQPEGPFKIEKIGDFTFLSDDKGIHGVNIINPTKYFNIQEGVHTLNKEQIEAINNIKTIQPVNWFSVGEIVERSEHPKTNKLFILKVKTNKLLNIVTNSLNSTVGNNVVVANIGATLPSGIKITKSKVMGIESEGMLCGPETLGLNKAEGVLIVNNLKPGEEYIL